MHSTKGFLWATNNALSGIKLTSKHIKLDCDIILNDETFDENGNPSGGNGVVYEWTPSYYVTGCEFYGNNHSIYGLFMSKNNESSSRCLFSSSALSLFQDLTIDNCFLEGNVESNMSIYALCFRADIVENCAVKNTTLKNGQSMSSFTYRIGDTITNCVSYANLISEKIGSYGTAGIVGEGLSGAIIENCNFYGKIRASRTSAGIVRGANTGCLIENCNNYGNISGTQHTAGIISSISSPGVRIVNCKNYGKIDNRGQYEGGGIASYITKSVDIIGCENYGEVVCVGAGPQYTVGQIYGMCFFDNTLNEKIEINIINCKTKSKNKCFVMYYPASYEGDRVSQNFELNVKNCEFVYLDSGYTGQISIMYYLAGNKVNFENVVVVNKNKGTTTKLINIETKTMKIFAKNIIFEVEQGEVYCIKTTKGNIYENAILVIKQNKPYSYYGTDFSGLYIDWKTGKIGLKALSGKGFYQGEVSEEVLKQKGFQNLSA